MGSCQPPRPGSGWGMIGMLYRHAAHRLGQNNVSYEDMIRGTRRHAAHLPTKSTSRSAGALALSGRSIRNSCMPETTGLTK